ncbi:hypothetical protein SmJEL517_g04530 [Synchytrium microbalum]|uniref:SKP1 component POZ domain-containing protein n=1 Tax=Synchytrium microbalum TaxID=1806994 RepID=A0A507C2M8_9FUNG|nr:uncharacterized protein SmJEL517_g04530 [Synchytrium microbalum]TPX32334.1 hypothetical protein SmJEL517_g04530 [Synchytrium microbalum]
MLTEQAADSSTSSGPAVSSKVVMLETTDRSQIAVPTSDLMACTELLPLIKPNEVIKVPHISSQIFSMVLAYLRHHKGDTFDATNVTLEDARDAEMINMNNNDLLQMTMAADILGTEQLMAFLNKLMGKRMEGKTEDEIRSMFDIASIGKTDEDAGAEGVEGGDEDYEEMDDDEEEEEGDVMDTDEKVDEVAK